MRTASPRDRLVGGKRRSVVVVQRSVHDTTSSTRNHSPTTAPQYFQPLDLELSQAAQRAGIGSTTDRPAPETPARPARTARTVVCSGSPVQTGGASFPRLPGNHVV